MKSRKQRKCKKCDSVVVREKVVREYPYYCPCCDENMFRFETYKTQRRK
jgi:Zn finger protein HypA/HybF involved in hydrogenase expression